MKNEKKHETKTKNWPQTHCRRFEWDAMMVLWRWSLYGVQADCEWSFRELAIIYRSVVGAKFRRGRGGERRRRRSGVTRLVRTPQTRALSRRRSPAAGWYTPRGRLTRRRHLPVAPRTSRITKKIYLRGHPVFVVLAIHREFTWPNCHVVHSFSRKL